METHCTKLSKVDLGQTGKFSKEFIDYLTKAHLKEYYGLSPQIKSFKAQIQSKVFSTAQRQVLVKSLRKQYGSLPISAFVEHNFQSLLSDNTFTITTGHQLNIFSGPLYFIYKIVTAINTAKVLKKQYPEHDFVPVYWMASEDHDFEEINHFRFNKETLRWHSAEKGAVGQFTTDGLEAVLAKIENCPAFFKDAYAKGHTLAQATRQYVNHLFGEHGLVILDADDTDLKTAFKSVILDDLKHHTAFHKVNATSTALNNQGFKTQISPREINFFYLDKQLRERIVFENGTYQVLNTNLSFNKFEIEQLVHSHPEKFSPNVVLRPLYQEMILPNLAYIGGPAEVVYWLQLKGVFDHYQVPFPILLPRNFGLYINKNSQRKLQKLGLNETTIFQDHQALKAQLLAKNSSNSYELNLESTLLQEAFALVKAKAEAIDKSLVGMVNAEETKTLKVLDQLQKRLKKSEERNHETVLNQLEQVMTTLFPSGGLQERTDNFLQFYIGNPDFIETLLTHFDPFDFQMHVLIEDE